MNLKFIYMKNLLLILIIGVVLHSCKEETDYVDVSFSVIADRELYGAGDEGIVEENLVITSETDWNEIWTKLNSVNDESSHFTDTTFNFNEQDVIGLFDQVQNLTGYDISINEIRMFESEVQVHYSKSNPGDNGTGQALMQPYQFVVVEKSNLPYVFILD